MKSEICLFIIAFFQVAQSLSKMSGTKTSPASTRTSASSYPSTRNASAPPIGTCFHASDCQFGLACTNKACGFGKCVERVGLNQKCWGELRGALLGGVVQDQLSDFSNCKVGLVCEKEVDDMEGFKGVCKVPSNSTQPLSKTVSGTETAYIPINSFTITVGPTATGAIIYDDRVTISSAKSLSLVAFFGLLAFNLL